MYSLPSLYGLDDSTQTKMGCENNPIKLIEKIRDSVENGEKSAVFSFEFYPPRTRDGLDSLIETIERFVAHRPLFCDITWRSNGSSADLTPEIVNRMQNSVGVEAMMHLTCTNMSVEKIDHALETIKSCGVRNVLALRGDPPKQSHETTASFAYALDLVLLNSPLWIFLCFIIHMRIRDFDKYLYM